MFNEENGRWLWRVLTAAEVPQIHNFPQDLRVSDVAFQQSNLSGWLRTATFILLWRFVAYSSIRIQQFIWFAFASPRNWFVTTLYNDDVETEQVT